MDTLLKIGRTGPRIKTTRFWRGKFLRIGVIASQYMSLEAGYLRLQFHVSLDASTSEKRENKSDSDPHVVSAWGSTRRVCRVATEYTAA
jgi:hypothetical protein